MRFQKLDRVRVNEHFLTDFLDEGGVDSNNTIANFVGKIGSIVGTYRYLAVHFDDGDEGFFTERELDFISRPEV